MLTVLRRAFKTEQSKRVNTSNPYAPVGTRPNNTTQHSALDIMLIQFPWQATSYQT
jgi:hypothetical protein